MGLKQEMLLTGDHDEILRLIKVARSDLKQLSEASARINTQIEKVDTAMREIKRLAKQMSTDFNQRSLFDESNY